ncbi:MAG TPA: ferritin-like domain-containing protein [Balneolaceae bacterium]|nr:ferritin-like domain-containing protein [Balneolaceae bacterium]
MTDFHEPPDELSKKTRMFRRALHTMMEELEAIDWYQQRIDVTEDEDLRKILSHNRDEEFEHASMTLEWMRRNMEGWDKHLKTYLFTEGEITELEEESGDSSASSNGLNIGKVK